MARPLPPATTKNCRSCKNDFETFNKKQIFCSNACKLNQLNAPKSNPQINCHICSDLFIPRNKRTKYCNSEKSADCIVCGAAFTYICESQASFKLCGKTCTAAYNLKDRKIVICICAQCGDEFSSSHRAKNDCGNHKSNCLTCGKEFSTKYSPSRVQNYCSTYCHNLKNSKAIVTKELILEYKDPEVWSKKFVTTNGYKPTSKDFQIHFGISKVPPRAKEFLSKKRGSLEDPVFRYLESLAIEVLRNTRPLRHDGKRLEIDLLMPNLKLGFEVQDFKTHAHKENIPLGIKEGDERMKNGPTYHELKRQLALDQLEVTLVDIWEDSINDGSYKKIVMDSIHAAQQSILVK